MSKKKKNLSLWKQPSVAKPLGFKMSLLHLPPRTLDYFPSHLRHATSRFCLGQSKTSRHLINICQSGSNRHSQSQTQRSMQNHVGCSFFKKQRAGNNQNVHFVGMWLNTWWYIHGMANPGAFVKRGKTNSVCWYEMSAMRWVERTNSRTGCVICKVRVTPMCTRVSWM